MLGYRAALQWMLDNDDTSWVGEGHGLLSVTASLVADIYGQPDEKVKADLERRLQAPFKARRRNLAREARDRARHDSGP